MITEKEDTLSEKNKKNLFFKKADVFLYASIFLFISFLFVLFVLLPKLNDKNVVNVYYKNQEIISVFIKTNNYTLTDCNGVFVKADDNGEEIVFSVYIGSEMKDYNIITYKKSDKSIFVSDSNCSSRKDCVYTSPIKNGKGIIICAPHELKIVAKTVDTIPVSIG